ncbi:Ff.00g021710.m01.CDS01 [Fusarium sp. VM40]|nr:Ff.00g021710.m01.CDS01 [Fusarium sp. VM40]
MGNELTSYRASNNSQDKALPVTDAKEPDPSIWVLKATDNGHHITSQTASHAMHTHLVPTVWANLHRNHIRGRGDTAAAPQDKAKFGPPTLANRSPGRALKPKSWTELLRSKGRTPYLGRFGICVRGILAAGSSQTEHLTTAELPCNNVISYAANTFLLQPRTRVITHTQKGGKTQASGTGN